MRMPVKRAIISVQLYEMLMQLTAPEHPKVDCNTSVCKMRKLKLYITIQLYENVDDQLCGS